jgi:hypothetical protein
VSESIANRLRSLLASDVYTEKGRLRSDDLLIRQRVVHGIGEATTKLKQLISDWRTDRVPPSTREQPFPPAEVMEPIRRAERLIRSMTDLSTMVNGLPVLNQDRVWKRIGRAGLDELLQFDWTLVGEADGLATAAGDWGSLDEVGAADVEARLKRIRDVATERRRYLEIQALSSRPIPPCKLAGLCPTRPSCICCGTAR